MGNTPARYDRVMNVYHVWDNEGEMIEWTQWVKIHRGY